MAGKLWDKGYEPDKMIEEYTVGDDRELDMRLARYDVEGSLAHIAMLETIGLLTAEELEKLTAGLKEIAAEIEAGRFEIEPGSPASSSHSHHPESNPLTSLPFFSF